MLPLFLHLFSKIRRLLASRAENKRLKVIREALQNYASKRGINLNNKNTL